MNRILTILISNIIPCLLPCSKYANNMQMIRKWDGGNMQMRCRWYQQRWRWYASEMEMICKWDGDDMQMRWDDMQMRWRWYANVKQRRYANEIKTIPAIPEATDHAGQWLMLQSYSKLYVVIYYLHGIRGIIYYSITYSVICFDYFSTIWHIISN